MLNPIETGKSIGLYLWEASRLLRMYHVLQVLLIGGAIAIYQVQSDPVTFNTVLPTAADVFAGWFGMRWQFTVLVWFIAGQLIPYAKSPYKRFALLSPLLGYMIAAYEAEFKRGINEQTFISLLSITIFTFVIAIGMRSEVEAVIERNQRLEAQRHLNELRATVKTVQTANITLNDELREWKQNHG